MPNEDKIKAKVVNIIKDATPKKPAATRKRAAAQPTVSVEGNGNITAGRDVNINKKETIRHEFTPGPEHITPAQARTLQKLVDKATEIEEKAGGDRSKSFAKWWKLLKDQYNVGTYREIPSHLGDHAIAWLKQKIAIMRPKLRRNDNTTWRKEHYTAIYAKARELGISKGEVYAIVESKLGVKVISLTKLGEQNLKKLYNIIMAM